MKRAIITGLLVIGAACLILGCSKKEGSEKQDKANTEASGESEDEEENEKEPNEEKDGSEEDAQAEDAKPDEAETEAGQKVIGTESADAHKIMLTNHTGEAITGFTVKASTDEAFPDNLMDADMKVEQDETVCFYYAPSQAEGQGTGTGKMLRTTYEFSISNESGREVRIAGLIFDDIEAAELCFEDEVGFIKYVSVDSGEEISTKEMALSMQAQ